MGCFKNIDGEGRKYDAIKTNSRFSKLFCVYSNLLKTANVGKFSLKLNPWGLHPNLNRERKIHHRVFISTSSKQRHIKKFNVVVTAKNCNKKRATHANFVL